MTKIRSFVAIPVSLKPVLEFAERIGGIRGVKGVEPANLHLTLKFLGDVDLEKDIPEIRERLEEVAVRHTTFTINFRGTGAFPDLHRIKVAWIGVSSQELLSLGEDVLSSLPYRMEVDGKKGFNPHLTIGRIKHPGALKEVRRTLREYEDFEFGEMVVREFYLMKSVLTPSGPVYSEIAIFGLKS